MSEIPHSTPVKIDAERPIAPLAEDSKPPVATMSGRRRFLAGSGLATLGILGGCTDSGYRFSREELANMYQIGEDRLADFFKRGEQPTPQRRPQIAQAQSQKPIPNRPKPAAWKPRRLTDEESYREFLATIKLDHISPEEIIRPHRNKRSGVANSLPPKHLWSNLQPTLEVADEIRRRLGVKLRYINSIYRSPDYNAVCSGAAKRSYHMQNLAMDLMFDCKPAAAAEMAKKLRSEGKFKGGVGLYSTFIHIDTRGYNSTWG